MVDPSPLDEILLDVVSRIPAGSLASYSDLSGLAIELGFPCTPRRVARTLAQFGGAVPWWRVVQSGGTIAGQVLEPALALLKAEGVPVLGRRVPLSDRRWSPDVQSLRAEIAAQP